MIQQILVLELVFLILIRAENLNKLLNNVRQSKSTAKIDHSAMNTKTILNE